MKIYKLRFEDLCLYEVEAENEEEALKKPVPIEKHRASITIIPISGYGKTTVLKENFYYCPRCDSPLPTLQCPKCQLQIHTELDKFLTLEEMKNIMRKMLREENEWNCDMLIERIYEAQKKGESNEEMDC